MQNEERRGSHTKLAKVAKEKVLETLNQNGGQVPNETRRTLINGPLKIRDAAALQNLKRAVELANGFKSARR
jgi:hypothetical protein